MIEGGICPCWNADNVTDSLLGRLIYKDECARCFATPKDPSGLNVCLKTFVGTCCPPDVPPEENHCLIQIKNTSKPLVMNIKKVPKKSDGKVEVTKLAIGKPGGIDPETDKYDTFVEVYCFNCCKTLDKEHAKIKPLIDSILLSQSANESSQV
jgi:ubiquitin carboxyl-terminal hydrolase 5/13